MVSRHRVPSPSMAPLCPAPRVEAYRRRSRALTNPTGGIGPPRDRPGSSSRPGGVLPGVILASRWVAGEGNAMRDIATLVVEVAFALLFVHALVTYLRRPDPLQRDVM